MRTRILVLLILILGTTAPRGDLGAPRPSTDDASSTRAWRDARERDLRSDTGWLTVSGLVFLKPGPNTVGSDPENDVVLPPPASRQAGRLIRDGAVVHFEPSENSGLTLNDAPVTGRIPLTAKDRLKAGPVTFHLHESGDRLGVRVRDANSELRRTFTHLRWFPIRESWKIEARFVRYPSPQVMTVPNVIGDFERLTLPGEAVFEVDGREVRLQAATAGDRLWFIFRDGLSGRETYRIRFLYSDAPDESGRVVLDFNRAYNPPCAYNPNTTCPLPPAQNRLSLAIDAGEKIYR